jgi:hypothetical protein
MRNIGWNQTVVFAKNQTMEGKKMETLCRKPTVTRKAAYSRRLASMYSQLQRKQQRGADLSKMDEFLEQLRGLVDDYKQANAPVKCYCAAGSRGR